MLDCLITGGTVVDGTGAPGRVADVAVQGGRIVGVGAIDDRAARTIDARGLVVCPGFIDLHTHYDAQVFWDATLSPSPLHGVTTVFGGNCGFTIAPLAPEDADYLMRMLARVEGMPLESLQAGVPWDWRSYPEYLDRLEGGLVPNAGFMVGHSAIRRAVLHEEANRREATDAEIRQMQALLREGLAAGGMGFSSTWSTTHNDHNGDPVPSRAASFAELVALSSVVSEFPGTTLEFIPGIYPLEEEAGQVMVAMSQAANRPLNWNVLQVYARNRDANESMLAYSDVAAREGARVLALTLPDSLRTRVNFISGFGLDFLPGWASFMALPESEKLAILSDPQRRAALNDQAQSAVGAGRATAHWAMYEFVETFAAETKAHQGRTVGEVARDQGKSAWDALCDVIVADGLRTSIQRVDVGQDDESWRRRVEVWRDGRTVVGASDAGAHLDMIDSFNYATTLLGRAVRERGLLPIEEAVCLLTEMPRRLYGVKGRGRVAEGWQADLVVLDPARIGPGPVHTRTDLPAGAARLYGEAVGIEHVFVNGVAVVEGTEFTDARPGTLLRSGRDTETVTAN